MDRSFTFSGFALNSRPSFSRVVSSFPRFFSRITIGDISRLTRHRVMLCFFSPRGDTQRRWETRGWKIYRILGKSGSNERWTFQWPGNLPESITPIPSASPKSRTNDPRRTFLPVAFSKSSRSSDERLRNEDSGDSTIAGTNTSKENSLPRVPPCPSEFQIDVRSTFSRRFCSTVREFHFRAASDRS